MYKYMVLKLLSMEIEENIEMQSMETDIVVMHDWFGDVPLG